MATYEVFQCNVCKQKTEKPINQTHATIDRCDITYKCVGKLVKIGESDVKSSIGALFTNGLPVWQPRGQQVVQPTPIESIQIPVLTGPESLTLAVPYPDYAGPGPITMVLEQKALGVAPYIEYNYTSPSGTTLITGQDSSSRRLTLRFTANDTVKVYVNGVALDAAAYDRSVPGRITLAQPLVDVTSTVKVIVYQQAAPVTQEVVFVSNENVFTNATAWGNVTWIGVPRPNNFRLFSCNDFSSLKIGTTLSIASVKDEHGNPLQVQMYLMLASKPYSSYDKDYDNAINVNAAIALGDTFQYVKDDVGAPTIFADSNNESIVQMFPPIAIMRKVLDDLDNGLVNSTNTVIQNKYIT